MSGVPRCHWGAPREMRLAGPGRAADAKTGKLPGTEGNPGVPGKLAAARIPILVPAPRAPPLSPDRSSLSSGAAHFAKEETEASQRQRPPRGDMLNGGEVWVPRAI